MVGWAKSEIWLLSFLFPPHRIPNNEVSRNLWRINVTILIGYSYSIGSTSTFLEILFYFFSTFTNSNKRSFTFTTSSNLIRWKWQPNSTFGFTATWYQHGAGPGPYFTRFMSNFGETKLDIPFLRHPSLKGKDGLQDKPFSLKQIV